MPLSPVQTKDITKQYDPLRKRAQQQEAANLQGQRDAMARRFASMGGGPGGAQIKQENVIADQSAQRLAAANEGIDAQQQGALNAAREAQLGRDFQTSERLGSQKFASGESALARKFQTSERLGSQDFADKQRQAAENFTNWQNTAAMNQANEHFNRTLEEQARQYNQDFDANKTTNAINTILSSYNSGLTGDQIGAFIKAAGLEQFLGILGVTSDWKNAPQNQASTGAPKVKTQFNGSSPERA